MTSAELLPAGWRCVRFGDVVRQVKDRVDPDVAGIERYVAGEHMDRDDLRIRRWGTVGDGYLGPAFHMRFRPGHVLYGSRRTYLRKVAVADFEGICANTTFVLEPSTDELLPEFLPLVMTTEAFHAHSIGQSKGSVNPYVNFRDLRWYELRLPSAEEQRRIVDAVNEARAVADRYSVVVRAASTALEAVRFHLIEPDFAGKRQRLGSAVEMAMGRVYPSADYGENGHRLLRPGNIAAGGEIRWTPDSTVHLPSHYVEARGTVMLCAGDIVMNLTAQSLEEGFLGRVCLADDGDESIVNQRIARIRPLESSPKYLFQVLQHPRFRDHIALSAKGSKIKHLYWRDLAQFEVPVPDEARQAHVISRIDAADQVLAWSLEARAAADHAVRVLAADLVRGAVRV